MAKHFELVYGKSGAGKTKWWMKIAQHIYKTTGKTTRLYIGDGGLATVIAEGLIEDGIVEACHFTTRDYPLTVTKLITQGQWPSYLPADEKGMPNGPLVPFAKSGAENVGMFVFEGISVIGEYILGSTKGGLADRAANGESIGPAAAIQITEGGERFGSNGMGAFGLAQRRIIDIVRASQALPGFILWTAHERAAEDKDDGNEKIIGPDAAGKALVAKIGLWFGNMTHLTTATRKVKRKDPVTGKDVDALELERRAYTRDHTDPDGTVFVKYLANSRVPLVLNPKTGVEENPMPEYLAPPDPLKFYRILREAQEANRKAREAAPTDAEKAVAL